MQMTSDLIVIAVVFVLVCAAALYIRKEKKSGNHCIGCPHGKSCAAAKNGCCSCHLNEE